MQVCFLLRYTAALCLLSLPSLAQSAISESNPLPSVPSQAIQAFSAGKPVASVEMTGTVQWSAGVTKDSGPAKLTAKITGENRAEFDLGNGTRVEAQSAIGDDRTCTWSGKDGVSHDMASSNCWTATVWFLPHLALQSTGLPSALSTQSLGIVSGKVQNAPHVQNQLTIAHGNTKPAVTALIRSWSTTDLTLDPVTLLPNALKYSIHPDNNSNINLLVEVRYSNYERVSGVQLPMHIERYVNGSLQLSIDIDSAVVN